MNRISIIQIIGKDYHTTNIENGEWSYVQAAGDESKLIKALGRKPKHLFLDIRFQKDDIVVLVETKQSFTEDDKAQLAEYLEEEKVLNPQKKYIAILANTKDDKIKVWKMVVDEEHLLKNETVIDTIDHYINLFSVGQQNDREKVLKNTYDLNELLHKMDIREDLRSQFVGTTLLYVKSLAETSEYNAVNDDMVKEFEKMWSMMTPNGIVGGISDTLSKLLGSSENKDKKVQLLQRNVLDDQKIKALTTENWVKILKTILVDIYKYIDTDSSEGQDILNLFFVAFNKYTGKSDKNQAFTPDHITEFMCQLTKVDRTKVVLDATCGSGAFLVQAMVKELADCKRGTTEEQAKKLKDTVTRTHIYGIELEEKAYGLATTNMLIHGDGNSNIKLASCFDCADWIKTADPDIILMNPPYNAKPIGIPTKYKKNWKKSADGKEDPTKGLVFIHFLSDIIKEMNEARELTGQKRKTVKLAVLLPMSAAIGTSSIIADEKKALLEENTLEAVFTLPNEVFYPGASVAACCMLFTMGQPHADPDGNANETFFGYYKEDGFKKKKNIGRVEQFDSNGDSKWKTIEKDWLKMFNNKKVVDGLSAMAEVNGDDEWLCEAYMKTDYSKLTEADFQQTLNNYLAYLLKEGKIYES